MNNETEKLILEFIEAGKIDRYHLQKMQRRHAKTTNSSFDTNDELLLSYHNLVKRQLIKPSKELENIFRLKNTRSASGIVVISVLTKPYECPGKCLYCPSEPDVPKSYLPNEPAVMRAISCKFDPFLQVESRLQALNAVGHSTDKINIRIIGGTWSYYPKQYQTRFIKALFQAANEMKNDSSSHKLTLDRLQTINETAKYRVVEISVETRQDYIDEKEIVRLRKLGVTKVELGVQSVDDEVLKINNRGNTTADTIRATKLLKDAGFKISYQMMPNLPGSDLAADKKMFTRLFAEQDFCPDHMKIYPLALLKKTGVFELYKKGLYKPYTLEELTNILKTIKSFVPHYCRIERVIRDIPSEDIVEGGSKVSNLRQVVLAEMEKSGTKCQCIRCREIKNEFDLDEPYKLWREDYLASNGLEVFLSIENESRTKLYSMLRLRIPGHGLTASKVAFPVLKNSSIVREIHTYGPAMLLGEKSDHAAQHQGFGKQLIAEAEKITLLEFELPKISIIAGIGVREYFRKLGYYLTDTYMTKYLAKK
jgi:elongator complex protein 3